MRRLLAATALLVASVTSCAHGGDSDAADRIRAVPDRLEQLGTARAAVTWSPKILYSPRLPNGSRAPRPQIPPMRAPAEFDVRRPTSAVLAGREPTQILDGTAIYRRRSDIGVSNRDKPWIRGDLAEPGGRIWEPTETSGQVIARAINGTGFADPALLVPLLAGALDGSVERVGSATLGAVRTTHYRFTLDRKRATAGFDRDRAATYRTLFTLFEVADRVIPAEVWLDDDGLPRRLVVVLPGRIGRTKLTELSVRLDLETFGQPIRVEVPEPKRVEPVGRLAEMWSRQEDSGVQAQAERRGEREAAPR